MKIQSFTCVLATLNVILFFTISCSRGHKSFYETKYPQVSFTLSVPNELRVQEAYFSKNGKDQVYRRIDSTGITHLNSDSATRKKNDNTANERRLIREPEYFFALVGRDGWDMHFHAILSGKYQDTAVVYDIERIKQPGFLIKYIFGPGRDSAYYADATYTEIMKDGRKLFKIVDAEGYNTTYTGMVGKYWFMLQFMVSGKDTLLERKIWEQSSFAN